LETFDPLNLLIIFGLTTGFLTNGYLLGKGFLLEFFTDFFILTFYYALDFLE
jgi:hypothetical protein